VTRPSSLRPIVAALFFVSGLSSLVLETVWVRMMVLVFGSTHFAVSTVLTAYMGGLALGSYVAGRRADRLVDPRRAVLVYGVLELGIGLYALALPLLAVRLPAVHTALWGTAHSSYYGFALLRFLLAAALLLIPTVAMGATLPVLARFYCGDDRRVGTDVGSLYAINTAGAVVGVLLAGFVLLPLMGQRATNSIACLADLLLGVSALLIARGRALPEPPASSGLPALEVAVAGRSPLAARLALVSIGVSGAVAMIYQVAWSRALSMVIGSSTYAFSLILLCVLIGLAGGAAIYARRHARRPDQPSSLSLIHLLLAATAFGGLLILDHLPVLLLALLQQVELRPTTVFLLQFVLAGIVILPPALLSGMLFPAVISLCAGRGRSAARTTGDVYAINTLGAIVGSFAGGFLLVPGIGLQRTLLAMVLVGLLLSALFGSLAAHRRRRLALVLAALASGGGALALFHPWNLDLMTAGVFRVSRYQGLIGVGAAAATPTPVVIPGEDRWRDAARRIIPPSRVVDTDEEPTVGQGITFHREGVATTASILRAVDESLSDAACWVRRTLLVNGKPDASINALHARPRSGCAALLQGPLPPATSISPTGDTETQILSGLLPICVHGGVAPPQDVLVIGWGSGITVGAALRAPIRRLIAVELEARVIEAARAFEPENHAPQRDPRLRLATEDGRNYLAATDEAFDVIISEPSNPWIAGCGNLFTREFFRSVRDRLRPDGVFLQWLQAYEIAPENVWSLLGTLADEFEVHVFSPARASSDLLLVARRRRGPLPWSAMERCLAQPGVRAELSRIAISEPADLAARLLAGPSGVRRLSAGAPRNTDDNARIEFAAPKDLINYRRYSSRTIVNVLRESLGDGRSELAGLPADAADRLCWATLRAGRPRKAAESVDAASPSLRGCGRAAQAILRPPPPLDRALAASLFSDDAADRVVDAFGRGPYQIAAVLPSAPTPSSAFALLGHYLAIRNQSYRSILYLTAADVSAPHLARSYPLRQLAARQYAACRLYPLAVQEQQRR
jgi:spermidine synthase